MKRSVILILACAALLSSGCDFVRTLAGRPTSDDLEVMRSHIERVENAARYQARMDSLERVRTHVADSLAALDAYLLDSLSQTQGTIQSVTKKGGLSTTDLSSRYYIVVSTFWTRSYAEYKLSQCKRAGYGDATLISFRNGLLAVAICPSNSLNETLKKLHELRGNGICPPDGWILVNE
ncbi:MAG: hypothetical protein J6P62_10400 [Bacteroidales bacterium]|nr:hypothetical protein [Bacteroidales bacterium]